MKQALRDWRFFAGLLALFLIFGIAGNMEVSDSERVLTTTEEKK